MTDPGLEKRVPGATSHPEEDPATPPPSGWFGEEADLQQDGAQQDRAQQDRAQQDGAQQDGADPSQAPPRRGDAQRAMFGRHTETEQ